MPATYSPSSARSASACCSKPGWGLVDLGLEVGLGVRGGRPHQSVERPVGRRAAGERRQLRAPEVAEDVHEEQTVLGGRVARAEHRPRAAGGVDVGHAEGGVADDRDVVARAVRALRAAVRDAEARVLEQPVERPRVERPRRAQQVAVHTELVVAVGGARAAGQERRELRPVGQAVRARRQDVADAARVVGSPRLRLRGSDRRRRRERDGERHRRDRCHPPPHAAGSYRWPGARRVTTRSAS